MLKVYTLIYDFSLSTPLEVDGRTVSVVFGGGCKALRQNGEFSTTDRRLQEAIEQSPGYGRVYKLHKSFPTRDDNEECAPGAPAEKVCATVNEAAEWLSGLGCRKTDVNTSAKAVAAARLRGYALKFAKGE